MRVIQARPGRGPGLFVWAAALLLAVSAAARPALATCGSAACFLVTGTQEGIVGAGSFRYDVSFSYVDQSRKLSGTHSVDEVLVPKVDFENEELEPNHHREVETESYSVRIDLAYGVTEKLAILGVLPVFNKKYHEHYDDAGTPEEHFTNNDGTTGVGDVQVGLRYGLIVEARDLLLGGFMAKLPTGNSQLLDSSGEINEPTIQPGTGSYDFIASLYYSHHPFPSNYEWFASGSYRFNTRNELDYTIGNESILTGGILHSGPGRWEWSAQLNGRYTGRDEYQGDIVPSTGAVYINFTPGLSVSLSGSSSLYGYVQIPVYESVNEAQLAPKYGLVVGFSKTF